MRPATALVLAGVVVALGGLAAITLGGAGTPSGELSEAWVSETARNSTFNHHPIGIDGDVIVAPVADVAADDSKLSPTSCSLTRLAPQTGAVRWQTTTPPAKCFMHALSRPAIADVDEDGTREVVAATIQNATVVYSATDGEERARIPLSTFGYGQPTVANLTAASGPEIVTSDFDGLVVVADGDGTVIWERSLEETVWAPPVVADVDADDAREVVVGTDERTVAFSPDGTIDWQVETPGVDVQLGPAAVGSGRMLYTATDEGITALDGRDGSTVWHRSSRGGASLSHAAVRDGDGDGTPEVYYSEPGTVVGALEATTGDQVWSTRLGTDEYTMTPAPVVGDLTGDGTEEVVAVTNSGTVTVLAPSSGDQLAVYEREVPVWTFPTVGDVTDSSGSEILVRYGDGRVVALEYTESD